MSRAPGRVNLIGEHTDYNEGFVLPCALPFDTVIAASPSHDGQVQIHAEGFGELRTDTSGTPLDDAAEPWSLHLRGVHRLMADAGVEVQGWRGCISTDIPTGASLSSSAAVEVATINLLLALTDTSWTPTAVARLGQQVENRVLGLPSGIMDQLISASAATGAATLIDCRSLDMTRHRIPPEAVVVVMDTGSRRRLVDSAYADRRTSCERAAELLGVTSLREAGLSDLARLVGEGNLMARARHVITENARTVSAADAMDRADVERLGALMNASHDSLRDDYEVSGPELDAMVEIARGLPGCHGARMTGGGFAGCAVALVDRSLVDEFTATATLAYRNHVGIEPVLWAVQPAAGASVELL